MKFNLSYCDSKRSGVGDLVGQLIRQFTILRTIFWFFWQSTCTSSTTRPFIITLTTTVIHLTWQSSLVTNWAYRVYPACVCVFVTRHYLSTQVSSFWRVKPRNLWSSSKLVFLTWKRNNFIYTKEEIIALGGRSNYYYQAISTDQPQCISRMKSLKS